MLRKYRLAVWLGIVGSAFCGAHFWLPALDSIAERKHQELNTSFGKLPSAEDISALRTSLVSTAKTQCGVNFDAAAINHAFFAGMGQGRREAHLAVASWIDAHPSFPIPADFRQSAIDISPQITATDITGSYSTGRDLAGMLIVLHHNQTFVCQTWSCEFFGRWNGKWTRAGNDVTLHGDDGKSTEKYRAVIWKGSPFLVAPAALADYRAGINSFSRPMPRISMAEQKAF